MLHLPLFSVKHQNNEDVLKEMFPDLNEEKVKQALEFANSHLRLAINKVLEVTFYLDYNTNSMLFLNNRFSSIPYAKQHSQRMEGYKRKIQDSHFHEDLYFYLKAPPI